MLRGNGTETRHFTDAIGRLIRTVHPDGSETRYQDFDGRSCPRTVLLPGGVSVAQTADAGCQLLTRTVQGPQSSHAESWDYDALGRLLRHELDGRALGYQFDKLGYTRVATREQNGFVHELAQAADAAGLRDTVTYPSGVVVDAVRDATGRLAQLLPTGSAPVVSATSFAGEERVATRTFGADALALAIDYDEQQRPVAMRWTRPSDGQSIAELRYAFDAESRVVARQSLHEGGLADFFDYDQDLRIARVDRDARPAIESETTRFLSGFAAPVPGAWAPAAWAREFGYAGSDVLDGSTAVNPDGLPLPPFASVFGAPNALLAPTSIDATDTFPDAVGNLTRIPAFPRSSASPPVLQQTAQLRYDALGRLVRALRIDGCAIDYEYDPAGLLSRRLVDGATPDCVGSDLDFVWDGGNLVELRRVSDGVVTARFYYGDDGDELFAADLADATGALQRHYYVTDAARSVLALVDASGQVVERTRYDAWGHATIEAPDSAPPRVSRVTVDGDALVVEFSEPVLPPLAASGEGGFATAFEAIDDLFSIPGGAPNPGTVVYSDAEPGAGFRSALRFELADGIPPLPVTLHVAAGRLRDRWGNPNPAEQVLITTATPAFQGPAPGSTAPQEIGRSRAGSPFAFQGQWLDPDSGLVYMRARFYDPASGLFVQPDPAGIEDSLNPHAGLAHDPVNYRDPTGTWSLCSIGGARDCGEIGRELKQVAGEYRYTQDGIFGLAGQMILQSAGGILDLGTGVAQGLELAGEARRGPDGALDLVRGYGLVLGDAATVAGAVSNGVGLLRASTLGGASIRSAYDGIATALPQSATAARARAYVLSGGQTVRDVALQKLGVRKPHQILMDYYGYTYFEARAFLNRVERFDLVVTTRQGMNVAKLKRRQTAVRAGHRQKPFGVDNKTGEDAFVTADDGRLFTGDIDVAEIRFRSGRPLTSRAREFHARGTNDDYARRSGLSSVPIQHQTQLQALEARGSIARGFTPDSAGVEKLIDNSLLKKIGHPGHTVTIRKDRSGNLIVHRTPGWSVDAEIRQAFRPFSERLRREMGATLGQSSADEVFGKWSKWKWE